MFIFVNFWPFKYFDGISFDSRKLHLMPNVRAHFLRLWDLKEINERNSHDFVREIKEKKTNLQKVRIPQAAP